MSSLARVLFVLASVLISSVMAAPMTPSLDARVVQPEDKVDTMLAPKPKMETPKSVQAKQEFGCCGYECRCKCLGYDHFYNFCHTCVPDCEDPRS